MSKKTNIRSFRYSDEVAAILEQQPGQSINDKFEQLVLACYYKLPDLQMQHKELQKKIDRKHEELLFLAEKIEPAIRCVDSAAIDISLKYSMLLKQFSRVTQLGIGASLRSSEDV